MVTFTTNTVEEFLLDRISLEICPGVPYAIHPETVAQKCPTFEECSWMSNIGVCFADLHTQGGLDL